MTDASVRIGLMGDSIASGLGVRSERYIELVCAEEQYALADFSRTGSTLRQSWQRYLEYTGPSLDVMIIAHGITEPIPRPTTASMRFLPQRWRRLGWMDPRPYYSSKLRRRALERLESALRWRVKNLLIRNQGFEVLEELPAYASIVRQVFDKLEDDQVRIIILEPTAIDEAFFPSASERQMTYWNAARAVAGHRAVETRRHLHEWDDYLADHFHPNRAGHAKLADLILAELR